MPLVNTGIAEMEKISLQLLIWVHYPVCSAHDTAIQQTFPGHGKI